MIAAQSDRDDVMVTDTVGTDGECLPECPAVAGQPAGDGYRAAHRACDGSSIVQLAKLAFDGADVYRERALRAIRVRATRHRPQLL